MDAETPDQLVLWRVRSSSSRVGCTSVLSGEEHFFSIAWEMKEVEKGVDACSRLLDLHTGLLRDA